jgi:catechol 2,3-dioxygenase-like lactoylglutathione lyase family enzyme
MAPALTHIALQVKNIDASIAFYESFCGMHVVQIRNHPEGRVAWIAEPAQAERFIIVLIERAGHVAQGEGDFSHLGFALESRAAVDALAARAGKRLAWPPTQHPPPVGYLCGVHDPDGNVVEFSYGQPLGPGAEADSDAPG